MAQGATTVAVLYPRNMACSDAEVASPLAGLLSTDVEGHSAHVDSHGPRGRTRSAFALSCVAGALLSCAFFAPQRSVPKASAVQAVQQLSASEGHFGTVDAIYSFGSPGSANPALENLASEDRCFGGVRVFTENLLAPPTKQVDGAAMSQRYEHAKMPVGVLHWDADTDFVPCPGHSDWPGGAAVYANWQIHYEKDYVPRLQKVSVDGEDYSSKEPFASAYQFALLSFKAYESTENTKRVVASDMPGWKLVAKETRVTGSGSLYDEDPVLMVQNEQTLECTIAFAGTNNNDNELATSSESYGTGYCGFDDVHKGYRNELWTITKDVWPKLSPKLAKCSKVSCAGHGLGGTLCEILAACANSGRESDPDFKQQSWVLTKPEMNAAIEEGSAVLAVGATKKCDDPPCQ